MSSDDGDMEHMSRRELRRVRRGAAKQIRLLGRKLGLPQYRRRRWEWWRR